MATYTQYLPDSLLAMVEVERGDTGETRSACVQRLIREGLSKAQRTGSLDPPVEKPARSPVAHKSSELERATTVEDVLADVDPELERRRRIAATHKPGCKCLNCTAVGR